MSLLHGVNLKFLEINLEPLCNQGLCGDVIATLSADGEYLMRGDGRGRDRGVFPAFGSKPEVSLN